MPISFLEADGFGEVANWIIGTLRLPLTEEAG